MNTNEKLALKIVQAGVPVLRQRAREMTDEEIHDPFTQTLIRLMRDTMRDGSGVGLAAPQVGLGWRLIVIEDRLESKSQFSEAQLKARGRAPIDFHVLINPVLSVESGVEVEYFEACLSLEGLWAKVPRSQNCKVEALNENGIPLTIEAEGWYARILQHEIDHLEGILYIDRVDSRTVVSTENYRRYHCK